ncbi:hypothetical protein BBK36DRAFT_1141636 [Trichoderma citrinoviride]|uniref:Uncharacterized protein n=1 Tax=Trichoderma citrinoviride TaxID=58853 RepID=A0A2T4B8M9_9HYPO|nr:hypothetical protein BBK36DRAFT_1141636 [Trichoderma citrinoviride]PTB65686.1 hypothetical protein BBK36DRAFT_1141636 [Trichoderma citrinoviride]
MKVNRDKGSADGGLSKADEPIKDGLQGLTVPTEDRLPWAGTSEQGQARPKMDRAARIGSNSIVSGQGVMNGGRPRPLWARRRERRSTRIRGWQGWRRAMAEPDHSRASLFMGPWYARFARPILEVTLYRPSDELSSVYHRYGYTLRARPLASSRLVSSRLVLPALTWSARASDWVLLVSLHESNTTTWSGFGGGGPPTGAAGDKNRGPERFKAPQLAKEDP